MLATETPEVRLALIGSIARSKDSNYTHDLADLLRDRDWRIRAAACDALAGMGGPIIETLKPFLADRDGTVRVAAMHTLLALGGESLVVHPCRKTERCSIRWRMSGSVMLFAAMGSAGANRSDIRLCMYAATPVRGIGDWHMVTGVTGSCSCP